MHHPEFSSAITARRAVLGLFAMSLTAHAYASEPVAVDDPTQRNIEAALKPAESSQWTLGAGAAYIPRYEGSDEYELRALPVVSYRNGAFSLGAGGLRYSITRSDSFEFGPMIGYSRGRDDNDGYLLRGLGDIDGGVNVGAYGQWRSGAWSMQADVKRGVGDAPEGTQARFGVGHATVLSATDRLLLGASLDWADDKYTQTFFGVDAGQSTRSALAAYTAEGGIKSFGVNAAWVHIFTPNWSSTLGAQVNRLAGDAADSPVTERPTSVGVTAFVAYRF